MRTARYGDIAATGAGSFPYVREPISRGRMTYNEVSYMRHIRIPKKTFTLRQPHSRTSTNQRSPQSSAYTHGLAQGHCPGRPVVLLEGVGEPLMDVEYAVDFVVPWGGRGDAPAVPTGNARFRRAESAKTDWAGLSSASDSNELPVTVRPRPGNLVAALTGVQ